MAIDDEIAREIVRLDRKCINHEAHVVISDAQIVVIDDEVEDLDERVSTLETGIPPPDPGDELTWNATLPTDRLYASVVVFNYTEEAGAAWRIVVDSAAVPTDDSVPGVSPPTGFTSGGWPSTNAVDSYDAAEDWYFYQYDDVAGIALVPPIVGTNDWIPVVPIDTLGPVWSAPFTLAAGDDANTDIKATFTTPVDAGIGLDGVDLHVVVGASSVLLLSDITSTTNYTVGTPGETVTYRLMARDESNNQTPSINDASITFSGTVTEGVFTFQDVVYSEDDDTGPLTVTVERSGASGASRTVDVSTRDRLDSENESTSPCIGGVAWEFHTTDDVSTAFDQLVITAHPWAHGDPITVSWDGGSQNIGLVNASTYYVHRAGTNIVMLYNTPANAIAGGAPASTGLLDLTAGGAETHILFDGANVAYEKFTGEEVAVSLGGGSTPFEIRLVTRAAAYNYVFQLDMDFESASGGAIIGQDDSCLCTINSSSSGTAGYTADVDGVLCFDPANTAHTHDDMDTDDYWSTTTTDNNAHNQDWVQPDNANTYGDEFTRVDDQPRIEMEFYADTVYYDAWIRGKRLTSWTGDICHLDINDTGDAGLLGFACPIYNFFEDITELPAISGEAWAWCNWAYDNTERFWDNQIGSGGSVGYKTLMLDQVEPNLQVDRIVLAPTALGYDPRLVGSDPDGAGDSHTLGPAESTYGSGGTVSDWPLNPTTPCRVGPSATITPTRTPGDGSTVLISYFEADMTGVLTAVDACKFTVAANGSTVTGTITGTGTSILRFTPSGPLSAGTTYTVTLVGTGINTSGAVKTFEPTWSATMIGAPTGDALLGPVNFTNRSTGTYTLSEVLEDFQHDHVPYAAEIPDEEWNLWSLEIEIVDDPTGSGRGHVMRMLREEGGEDGEMEIHGTFGDGNVNNTNNQAEKEAYFSYDIYEASDHIQDSHEKHPFFAFGTQSAQTHPDGPTVSPEGQFGVRAQIQTGAPTAVSNAWGIDGSIEAYLYGARHSQVSYLFSLANPTRDADEMEPWTSNAHIRPLGAWYSVEQYIKINDVWTISTITNPSGNIAEITTVEDHGLQEDDRVSIYAVSGGNADNLHCYATWDDFFVQTGDYPAERYVLAGPTAKTFQVQGDGAVSGLTNGYVGIYNGVYEARMRSPSQFAGVQDMVIINDMLWATHPDLAIDGVNIQNHYGDFVAQQSQYTWYDNFTVSTSAIL